MDAGARRGSREGQTESRASSFMVLARRLLLPFRERLHDARWRPTSVEKVHDERVGSFSSSEWQSNDALHTIDILPVEVDTPPEIPFCLLDSLRGTKQYKPISYRIVSVGRI